MLNNLALFFDIKRKGEFMKKEKCGEYCNFNITPYNVRHYKHHCCRKEYNQRIKKLGKRMVQQEIDALTGATRAVNKLLKKENK